MERSKRKAGEHFTFIDLPNDSLYTPGNEVIIMTKEFEDEYEDCSWKEVYRMMGCSTGYEDSEDRSMWK